MHDGNQRDEREKGEERIFEEIITRNFQNLIKDLNLPIKNLNEMQEWQMKEIHTKTQSNQIIKRQRQRENLESRKRKITLPINMNLNEIISRFPIRNHDGQRKGNDIFKVQEGKKSLQQRIL